MSKIKQIKQKTNGVFPDQGIPLGADGINIDMSSGLNLEEELIVGGKHSVKIAETKEDGKTITTITQYYYNNKADPETNTKKNIYIVKTTIEETQQKTIVTISLIDPISSAILRKKTIDCTDTDIQEELKK